MPCSSALPTPFGGFGLKTLSVSEESLRKLNRVREHTLRTLEQELVTQTETHPEMERINQNRTNLKEMARSAREEINRINFMTDQKRLRGCLRR